MDILYAAPPVAQVSTTHKAVASVLSPKPDRHAVTHLVTCCHRFALAYLYKKVRRGDLPGHASGLSVDDLAMDCIAEIFQRNESGAFCVLQIYFQNYNPLHATDIDVQVALRRLVFSKVNETLFRLYHETDPNLAKIIRNVKDAAKADPRFHLVRHHSKQWLVVLPPQAPETEALAAITARPMAPPELLEIYFGSHFGQHDRVRELTQLFVAFVEIHPQYAHAYPVTAFSQAIRASYARTHTASDTHEDNPFYAFEITNAIQIVTDQLEASKWPSYVGRGKVSDTLFSIYFETIRDIIAAQYLDDVELTSYYTALQKYLPDLSEEDYRVSHRNILEYLAKLARAHFINYMDDRP